MVVALVGHLGHQHINKDRHVHIYRPLFSWSTLLIESFFCAVVCLASGMALQLVTLPEDVPSGTYQIRSHPASGFALLLMSSGLSVFALVGCFSQTAFHRLHHLQLPEVMGGNMICPSAPGSSDQSTLEKGQTSMSKDSVFTSKSSMSKSSIDLQPAVESAIVMRNSWVKQKLSVEEDEGPVLKEEEASPVPLSAATTHRASMVESLFSAVPINAQPPAYTKSQSKQVTRFAETGRQMKQR